MSALWRGIQGTKGGRGLLLRHVQGWRLKGDRALFALFAETRNRYEGAACLRAVLGVRHDPPRKNGTIRDCIQAARDAGMLLLRGIRARNRTCRAEAYRIADLDGFLVRGMQRHGGWDCVQQCAGKAHSPAREATQAIRTSIADARMDRRRNRGTRKKHAQNRGGMGGSQRVHLLSAGVEPTRTDIANRHDALLHVICVCGNLHTWSQRRRTTGAKPGSFCQVRRLAILAVGRASIRRCANWLVQ